MYIDPNTGGILFQALAVILTASTGFVMVFYGRIRLFIARLRRKNQSPPQDEQ